MAGESGLLGVLFGSDGVGACCRRLSLYGSLEDEALGIFLGRMRGGVAVALVEPNGHPYIRVFASHADAGHSWCLEAAGLGLVIVEGGHTAVQAHLVRLDRLYPGIRLPGGGGRLLGLHSVPLVAADGRRRRRWEVDRRCRRAVSRTSCCCRVTQRTAVADEAMHSGGLFGCDGVDACCRRVSRTPRALPDASPEGLDDRTCQLHRAWQQCILCALVMSSSVACDSFKDEALYTLFIGMGSSVIAAHAELDWHLQSVPRLLCSSNSLLAMVV